MTTPHPNAHILARLAEIAQTTDKPWERFEWLDTDGEWAACSEAEDFSFVIDVAGRLRERILDPITINGKTFEGPMREAPKAGTPFCLLFDPSPGPASAYVWSNNPLDRDRFSEGRIFRTREARDAVQAELAKLLNGEV